MPKKPKPLQEGDHVILHGKVTRVADPADGGTLQVTVRIDGYPHAPITIGVDWIEVVEKGAEPKVRDLGI